jgi:hypothetical protein
MIRLFNKRKEDSKLRIGIDINEILRSRTLQFNRFYFDEFGEDGIPEENDGYVYDLRKYKFEGGIEVEKFLNEELPDDISPIDYAVDEETGEAPVDSLAFKKEEKFVSAEEKFNRFLYEDFLYEIFGSAPPMYRDVTLHLDKFVKKYGEDFEILIISKENYFSIPPTLFFLSKIMTRVKNFKFVSTNEEVWENVDVLLTTDPELLENVPTNKKVVRFIRPYNVDIKAKFTVEQIDGLVDNPEFDKLINYKK